MNKVMACLSFAMALSAVPSFGLNAIQQQMKSNPQLTPYEVLAQFYAASQPAQLTDIDFFTKKAHANAQKCVMASAPDRNPYDVLVVRLVYKEMAVPYQGPLFPGHPEMKKESIGVFGYIDDELPSMGGLADATTVTSDESDLIVSYRGGVANFNDSKPYVLKVRKSEGLVAFSYLLTESQNPTPKYGYCYRETARH